MRFAMSIQIIENNSIMTYRDTSEIDNNTVQARWILGGEYEFAYCSKCGRQEYADWNSTSESINKIDEFSKDYRYCPWCGTRMH